MNPVIIVEKWSFIGYVFMPKKLSYIDTGSDPKSYCVGKKKPKWDPPSI